MEINLGKCNIILIISKFFFFSGLLLASEVVKVKDKEIAFRRVVQLQQPAAAKARVHRFFA
jgi:hypothetical protein